MPEAAISALSPHHLALFPILGQIRFMDTFLTARPLSRIALGGFVLAALAGIALLLAGPGYRLGWWEFRPAFSIMGGAAYAGLAGAGLSLIGAIIARPGGARHGLAFGLCGIGIGLLAAALPWSWKQTVQRVPLIHDITTDLENPPVFVAVLPLRADAPNTAAYGGPEIAAQQRQGYPDLGPLTVSDLPPQAFERAVAAAQGMGWEIVASAPAEGRLEATDTTFWFGFKDDVVVRVAPIESGSRIDVRSVSRVGKSDVGANAKRIMAYLARIEQSGT